MSKRNRRKPARAPVTLDAEVMPAPEKCMGQVSFGKSELVLTNITDYQAVFYDNYYEYYEPPVNRLALSTLGDINAQHGGVIHARTNMVAAGYIKGGNMSREDVRAMLLNYLTFGDAPLLKVRNAFGRVLRLAPLPALYFRVRRDNRVALLQRGKPLIYDAEDVIFLKQYDTRQQIYGIPDYLGAVNSALLSTDATLFRRRFFLNGAHLGFIFYARDPNMTVEMEEAIRDKIEQSKGVGNFRNMFISIPKGDPDAIKLIPVGDNGVKDDFASIKNISTQDILNAQRFPPGLAGIIPGAAGGLGDPIKVRAAYQEDEVKPMRRLIMDAVNRDPDIRGALQMAFDCAPTPLDEM
ncbi:phage portal protein [Serratia marcescens]|uniref:phage portal protein n=1 Tax=Serratia marcescens TaxID=615 RepID=UPI00217CA5DF|nr:phage portal protein [Serratia marcescens]CAI1949634.1 phage portal protein, PBSX family [Serratia marcescens]